MFGEVSQVHPCKSRICTVDDRFWFMKGVKNRNQKTINWIRRRTICCSISRLEANTIAVTGNDFIIIICRCQRRVRGYMLLSASAYYQPANDYYY